MRYKYASTVSLNNRIYQFIEKSSDEKEITISIYCEYTFIMNVSMAIWLTSNFLIDESKIYLWFDQTCVSINDRSSFEVHEPIHEIFLESGYLIVVAETTVFAVKDGAIRSQFRINEIILESQCKNGIIEFKDLSSRYHRLIYDKSTGELQEMAGDYHTRDCLGLCRSGAE